VKITVVADCHLNMVRFSSFKDKESGIPYKSYDFMRSFEYIVSKNIEEIKPDLFVIAGDIFDTFDPSNTVRGFFNRQLRRLVDDKIPVIILVGNHDVCMKNHALSPLHEIQIKNVKIIDSPKLLQFKDHLLLLYPYSLDVERLVIKNKQLFSQFVAESKSKIHEFSNKPVLFFGHFGVTGANKNSGISNGKKITTINTDTEDITLSDLDSIGANYVFLGDYHEHQILNTKSCRAMYAGSIEKDDITQIEQKKGFLLYDTEVEEQDRYGKVRFIEYPNCRPMVSLYGSVQEIQDGIDALTESQTGAVVKIVYVGDIKSLSSFSSSIEKMRNQIRNKIQPIHIYDSQKITESVEEEKKIQELEQEVIEKGEITDEEIMDTVCEMLGELVSKEEYVIVESMAKKIYKESKGLEQ